MKVTNSTRICSAHFPKGSSIPHVRSLWSTNRVVKERHLLIRHTSDKNPEHVCAVPSLVTLAKDFIQHQLSHNVMFEVQLAELQQQSTALLARESELTAATSEVQKAIGSIACEKIPSFSCKITDDGIKLAHQNNYFLQVQGQLAITGAKWCDFCAYTSVDVHIQRIYPEPAFWQDVVKKLDTFYDSYCVPVLCNIPILTAEQVLAKHIHES